MSKAVRARRAPMRIETLESRLLLAAEIGTVWPAPKQLTVSFVPDGTVHGNQASSLFREMRASTALPDEGWQTIILQALQTWASRSNLNVSVVPDSGLPIGSTGAPQGDSRFGDIRISSIPMTSSVLAVASGYDPTAGTRSGDITFNSDVDFRAGGAAGYDLFTVALHEAGHVFGLDDCDDPTSVLEASYIGTRAGLADEDAADVQSIYGVRAPDRFEGVSGNETVATAAPITPVNATGSNASDPSVTIRGDIGSPSDKDVYTFRVRANPGPVSIQVRTTRQSSLVGRLVVTNSRGVVLGSDVADSPTRGDLTVRLPGLSPLETYFVRVEAADPGVFGVGGYLARVTPDTAYLFGTLDWTTDAVTNGLINLDLGTDDTLATANFLSPSIQSGLGVSYYGRASLNALSTVDMYAFDAPSGLSGDGPLVLSALVWGRDLLALDPRVTILDAAGKAVAGQVLSHEGNAYALQLSGLTPGARYYAKVIPYPSQAGLTTVLNNVLGNYEFAFQFHRKATPLDALQAGTIDPETARASSSGTYASSQGLLVSASVDQAFHLVLSAKNATGAADSAVRVELVDGSGRVVQALRAVANEQQSLTFFMARGRYTIRYVLESRTWGVPAPLSFQLDGRSLSDPNRPYMSDPSYYGGSSTGTSTGNGSGTTSTDTSTPYTTTAISYV